MAEVVRLVLDGEEVSVAAGTTVAAALLGRGRWRLHRSVQGQPRGPLCGMGVCFECRVWVDGRAGVRSCTLPCRDGMEVRSDG